MFSAVALSKILVYNEMPVAPPAEENKTHGAWGQRRETANLSSLPVQGTVTAETLGQAEQGSQHPSPSPVFQNIPVSTKKTPISSKPENT